MWCHVAFCYGYHCGDLQGIPDKTTCSDAFVQIHILHHGGLFCSWSVFCSCQCTWPAGATTQIQSFILFHGFGLGHVGVVMVTWGDLRPLREIELWCLEASAFALRWGTDPTRARTKRPVARPSSESATKQLWITAQGLCWTVSLKSGWVSSTHACMYVRMYAFVHTCTYGHMDTCRHTWIITWIHPCLHTCIPMLGLDFILLFFLLVSVSSCQPCRILGAMSMSDLRIWASPRCTMLEAWVLCHMSHIDCVYTT